jgi:hypothetical protein
MTLSTNGMPLFPHHLLRVVSQKNLSLEIIVNKRPPLAKWYIIKQSTAELQEISSTTTDEYCNCLALKGKLDLILGNADSKEEKESQINLNEEDETIDVIKIKEYRMVETDIQENEDNYEDEIELEDKSSEENNEPNDSD